MGEDRTLLTEKKSCDSYRQRHSSVISSCSEDAESETTSGYPPTPDSEELAEELEYGPGIVNKLRTRFLTISLKQNRGSIIRRSCSMENLLDQDGPCSNETQQEVPKHPGQPWNSLKRAKSMDTLLMDLTSDQGKGFVKETKLLKRGLNRPVQSICDEELPKPDTVKTYKRMFEPAESRRGSHCRRPPVLRASAKYTTVTKNINAPAGKVNGVTKNRFCAKQSSLAKSQGKSESALNGTNKKASLNGNRSISLSEFHTVKAMPLKISNGLRKGKNIENLNSINSLLNKNDICLTSESEIITNGDNLSSKKVEATVNHFNKNIVSHAVGTNFKPKIPPNKPSLKIPTSIQKNEDFLKDKNYFQKLKPLPSNGLKKVTDSGNTKEICSQNNSNCINSNKSPTEHNNTGVKPFHSVNKLRNVKKTINCDVISPSDKSKSSILITASDKRKNDIKPIAINKSLFVANESSEKNKKTEIMNEGKMSTVTKKLNTKLFLTNCSPSGDTQSPIESKVNGSIQSDDSKSKNIESPPHSKVRNEIKSILENMPNDGAKHSVVPETVSEAIVKQSPDLQESVFDDKTNPIKTIESLESPSKIVFEPSKMTTSTPDKTEEVSLPVNECHSKTDKNVSFKPNDETLKYPCDQTKSNCREVHSASSVAKQENRSGEVKPAKKSATPQSTSMVFDFRGKDVVSHVAVTPTPFGCKPTIRKRDGSEDEDEDSVDYSTPPPCGLVFEGENVRIGKGSILSTRNKELKISFVDEADGNTFIYPSEASLLEDSDAEPPSPLGGRPGSPPPSPKLKANTALAGSGLCAYTPSALRAVASFEPGMFRPSEPQDESKQRVPDNAQEMLTPAEDTVAWSASAGPTSDILF